MTTIKSPVTRMNPLPSLRSVRINPPLKSALSTGHALLPNIQSSQVLPKKRVRFALKSDEEEENPTVPLHPEKLALAPVQASNRANDPWRSNGPLYGTYTEYLEKKDAFMPETPNIDRPKTPTPEIESLTYTHTFLIQSKSPEIVVDSITVSTPIHHLPRIVQRTKPARTTIARSPSPAANLPPKQRTNTPIPPRKLPSSVNNRSLTPKRGDLILPTIKTSNSNERIFRTDQPLGTKIVNEYLRTKKVTEIITNPLPIGNDPVNYKSGHSLLQNLSKTPPVSCHSPLISEPCFFQNHKHDHFQPIIHSTH